MGSFLFVWRAEVYSSFIKALRRFLNRRGPIRQLRCDHGTNFVGARNELKVALKKLDQDRLRDYLLEWL